MPIVQFSSARLVGLARPPREQPVRLHLLDEAVEVLEVLGLAVRAQLVLDRRADVAVGRHHDVAVVVARRDGRSSFVCAVGPASRRHRPDGLGQQIGMGVLGGTRPSRGRRPRCAAPRSGGRRRA